MNFFDYLFGTSRETHREAIISRRSNNNLEDEFLNEMQRKKDKGKQGIIENYEKQKALLKQKGYEEYNAIIPIGKAYAMTFILAAPLVILFFIIFISMWGFEWQPMSLRFLLCVIISVPIHELAHGLAWSLFCDEGFKSIRFGMMWSSLTPYCNCKEPLGLYQYLIGALTPLMLLGVIPSIIGIIIGNYSVLCFGTMGIVFGGGDMAISLKMRKCRNALFLDHPTKCGFIAFLPSSE